MVISLENVVKIFGKNRVIDDVSVTFPSGKISVVVGEHGSGKTTMLRLVAGELKPDYGKITAKKRITKAFAYDNNNFFEGLKIADYCTVWTLLYRNFDTKKLISILSEAGIQGSAKVPNLSKEMKAWFDIALVISSNADIMIFDEPLLYIDQPMQVKILDLFEKAAEEGKTVIVGAQEISEFENSAEFVAVLNNGSLVMTGETEKLLLSHRLFPGASTISPDFKVIGPVLNERLIETSDDIGRKATLKEIVLGYINGNVSR